MQFEYFQREISRLRMENTAQRVQLALRKIIQVLKYREDQRRIPAGIPGGGRWTDEGGEAREEESAKDPPIRIAAPKGAQRQGHSLFDRATGARWIDDHFHACRRARRGRFFVNHIEYSVFRGNEDVESDERKLADLINENWSD